MTSYDYLLTGATGQIGRYLFRELVHYSTLAIVMRRKTEAEARAELEALLDNPLENYKVDVILGDIKTIELPKVEHILNAAGFTTLADKPDDRYWNDNIVPSIRLAHYAKDTGASFHQLSSVAVAEFRPTCLTEVDTAIPDTRQLPYSASKVLVELAVTSVLPRAQIFRIGDVVPPMNRMDTDWRRTHWLPILFSCGKAAFEHFPKSYGVWLADTAELAKAITKLMRRKNRHFHVLGKEYNLRRLKQYAPDGKYKPETLSKWMADIILHGPEASMVDCTKTTGLLAKEGFKWTELGDDYWTAFAKRSMEK